MKSDIGLSGNARKGVAEGLARLLGDTYALYLKTHNYHWNVTGPMFKAVHEMTEAQYMALAAAVDEIAERIRMLGPKAPGSFKALAELASVKDGDSSLPAEKMIADLVKGHETVIKTARAVREEADKVGDEATVGLIDGRLAAHEKDAWMLRMMIES